MPIINAAAAAIQTLIQEILGSRQAAADVAQDPHGTLAAHGITEQNLDGVDMSHLTAQALQSPSVPEHARAAFQDSTSGQQVAQFTPPPIQHVHTTVNDVQAHLNYVTSVVYKDDHSVTQYLDQSQHFTNYGENYGDVSFDQHNVNTLGNDNAVNTGDHGAAVHGNGNVTGTGHGDVTGATGDGSQANNDSTFGQNINGNNNAQVGGENDGQINTGVLIGNQGDHNGPVQIGEGNQADSVDLHGGDNNAPIDFGGGAIQNTTVAHNHAPVVTTEAGRDATTVAGNHVSDGSSIAAGHSAASGFEDNSFHENLHQNIHENLVDLHAHDSQVALAADGGQTDQDAEVDQHPHLLEQNHYSPVEIQPLHEADPHVLDDPIHHLPVG